MLFRNIFSFLVKKKVIVYNDFENITPFNSLRHLVFLLASRVHVTLIFRIGAMFYVYSKLDFKNNLLHRLYTLHSVCKDGALKCIDEKEHGGIQQ